MIEKYELIRSNRKTIAIEIKGDGRVVVRAPLRISKVAILAFVEKKSAWIEKHLAAITKRQSCPELPVTIAELGTLAIAARQDIARRVAKFAPIVGVTYGRITIRSQKTRWGSCSSKGNLNFNCLLMLCPEDIRDYVVVHELCHRKEMNHSAAFWAEVRKVLSEYEIQRQWLKDNGGRIIGQLKAR